MIEHLLAAGPGAVYSSPLVRAAIGGSLHPGGVELTRSMVDAAQLPAGAKVLDVGCGQGESSRLLAELGFTVTAIDRADADLGAARRACHGLDVRFLQSDAPLDAAPAGQDAILSECMLCLTESPSETLARFHALLVPGGTLLLSDMVVEDGSEAFRSAAGFIACLGGAMPYEATLDAVTEAGFLVRRAERRTDVLHEMRDRIRSRIDVDAILDAVGPAGGGYRRLVDEAEAALEEGRLGYAVIEAVKPS